MFQLQRTPCYWWPVKVKFAADGGKWEEEAFEAQFSRFDAAAFEAMMAEIKTDKLSDSQVVPRIVLDWRGVVDPSQAVVPFSRDALERMLKLPGVPGAIVQAWLDSYTQAAAGN